MNNATGRDLVQQTVGWLARLPLLCSYDLSKLLRVSEPRVHWILSELEGLGWCEWVTTTSPEVDERRLFVLSEAAQSRLAELQPTHILPIGRRETLARLPRLETAVGVNRFLAEFVAAVTDDVEVDLADARTLPWTGSRTNGCSPSDLEGYVYLTWGVWSAPAFIAWDRAAAPQAHRRQRVAGWYTYALSRRWDTMPIFVICPGEREADQWAQAVIDSADRRRCPPLTLFLATAPAAHADPTGEIWRKPQGRAEASFFNLLTKVPPEKSPIQPARLPAIDFDKMPVGREPLRKWSARVAEHPDGVSGSERIAMLSLATGALQKKALEWISHHTLLNSTDLSVLMNVPDRLAEKLLSGVEAHQLCQRLYKPDAEETEAPRYLLTSLGLRLLAARDGVPPRRYVRYGVIAAPDHGGVSQRLDTLVSQFEHTVGTNSFFVRLARDLRIQGGMLLRWLNAAESTQRFAYRGERRWLRPDGYAEFTFGGRVHRFFLEWDRGTTRHSARLEEKFKNYAHYFTVTEANDHPDLLVVTVSTHREHAIWASLKRAFGAQPPANVLTSVTSLITGVGPLWPVWRGNSDEGRRTWQ